MPNRRLQIMLDDNRYRKVYREARRRGISVATVIREAIDALPETMEQREKAIAEILAAEPMPVPDDPQDLRIELDNARYI